MTARPRLLFVSPQFLFPADAGGKIRTTGILRGMLGGRFHITLAAPATEAQRAAHPGDIASVCDAFVAWPPDRSRLPQRVRTGLALLSPLPANVATDRSAAGAGCIRRALEEPFDVTVFDFVHAAVLAPDGMRTPSVLFTHNVEAEIFARHAEVAGNPLMRALWRSQQRKMERFERASARRFTTVVCVSQRDSDAFSQWHDHVRAIPTGVDLDFFHAAPDPPAGEPPHASDIVFTGSMDWMANIDGIRWFMEAIWPRVVAERPATTVRIVGKSPPPALLSAAQARGLPWTFTGRVDDIRPHVHGAKLYIVPLRVGGGTRIKLYEAMAMGRAVVSTALGAEGLPVRPGEHYRCADSDEDFAREILDLLGDPGPRAALAAAARRFVEQNFSQARVAESFEAICTETLDRARAPRAGA